MFENCIIKYRQFMSGINDSVDIIYPANGDGVVITKNVPMSEDNTDYQNILEWVAEGNTIAEAD